MTGIVIDGEASEHGSEIWVGSSFTATSDETPYDYRVDDPCLLLKVQIQVDQFKDGDYVELFIRNTDNTSDVSEHMKAVPIPFNGRLDLDLNAQMDSDQYLRVVYHATPGVGGTFVQRIVIAYRFS